MPVHQGSFTLTGSELQNLTRAFSLAKAENDDLLIHDPHQIFVHTNTYSKVQGKTKCLIVGRKGTGKSALIQSHVKLSGHDFHLAQTLRADRIMFERIAAKAPPSESLASPERVVTAAWYRSIVMFSTLTAAEWLINTGQNLSKADIAILKAAIVAIGNDFSLDTRDPGRKKAKRSLSLVEWILQLFTKLTLSLSEESRPQAPEHEERSPYLKMFLSPFSPEIIHAIQTIQRIGYRSLISLDDVDEVIESILAQKPPGDRHDVLFDLLKGLMLALSRLDGDRSFEWLHILVAVPEDKLLELKVSDVATLEKISLSIGWTPEELRDCVNRRLSRAIGRTTRWEDLFPFEIKNGSPHSKGEDGFLYLLRHTSLKPRELMTHLRTVFSKMETSGGAIDAGAFEAVIQATTETIVEEIFLPEYAAEYPGLEGLLRHLRAANLRTVTSLVELERVVRGWYASAGNRAVGSHLDDLVLLFDAGVVGIRETSPVPTARTVAQGYANVIFHFSFNGASGRFFRSAIGDAQRSAGRGHPINIDIVFAPMFAAYLRLAHVEPFPVNQIQ